MRLPPPRAVSQQYRYVRWSRRLVIALFDHFLRALSLLTTWFRGGTSAQWPATWRPRSILVVQLDHFGDAVLTLTLLRGLQILYPQVPIDVLASRSTADVFAASRLVRRVWVYRRNRFDRDNARGWLVQLFWWAAKLRGERYDLAIDPRGDLLHAWLMWLAGAARRVGWAAGGGAAWLTDSPEYEPQRAETLSRLALLNCLNPGGVDLSEALPDATFFPLSPAAQHKVRVRWLKECQAVDAAPEAYVVLHLGAGTAAKRWPLEHWLELQQKLLDETSYHVCLIGTRAEQALAAACRARFGSSPRFHDWTGQSTVEELAALLDAAAAFVGSDSGPAHLAGAVGTPTLVLFSGANDSQQWAPWGAQVQVVSQPVACAPCYRTTCAVPGHPCQTELLPARVWTALQQLLAEANAPAKSSIPAPHFAKNLSVADSSRSY